MAMTMIATSEADSLIPSLNVEKSPLKEEEELWSRLNKRTRSLSDSNDEKKKKKKKTEGMKLLDEGLQAVASSLTQLTHTLETAPVEIWGRLQEGTNLGETLLSLSDEIPIAAASSPKEIHSNVEDAEQVDSKEKLRNHQNVAKAMAAKARFLERQMKSLKADLIFVRERCAFLEVENARLRDRDGDGDGDGVRPEEDDLVRLQLEALLAEKGRLAQENANYARENEYLHQLVEYHQLTLQEDIAAMPRAMCLDFSSASPSPRKIKFDDEDDVVT